tara:strand:+ start:758 stop:2866 length:2109 start_codon:yes stop_codon:yes gene_type:complete
MGYIYIRWHSSYKNLVKLGRAACPIERDQTYITGEPERGYYLLILKVEDEELCEQLLADEFKEFHYNGSGGTEFYDRDILYKITDVFNSIGIHYEECDSNDINRKIRMKKLLDTIKKRFLQKKMKRMIAELRMKTSHKYVLKGFQEEIITKSNEYYKNHNVGSIIIPCGTGKTVIGSFICKFMNRVIIGVPSKILINQWKEKIENILPNHKLLVVDSNYDSKDTGGNNLVIVTTYHSCYKIKGIFDMKIGDECHHLVGENKNEKGFKYFHKIESNKTLFLTATKKIVVQKDDQKEIYSMDNFRIFGEVIYENNLRWAIENNLITDYSLVCLKNNEETIQEIMRNCKIDGGNIELFLSAFISLKSLVKYEGLSHILIYANNTKNSEKIIEYIDIILENKLIDIDKGNLYHDSLHSNSNHDITSEIDKFRNSIFGIISCVYIFGEGFDLPKLNGVVFAENMESDIRIIQSTTRCFRLNKDEPDKRAFVIIPYLDKDDWNDDNESFQKLRKIVYQIRNEDKNIEHKIRLIDINKEKDYSIQNIFYKWKKLVQKDDGNDPFIDDEEENGLHKLKLRLIKSKSLKSRFDSEEHELYEYMKERNKELNLKSKSEYNRSMENSDYIEGPESKFGLWWKNWYSFLGYDTSYFIQIKDEWIIECKKNNIKSLEDYKELCENDLRFPINPGEFYEHYTNFDNELNLNTRRRR